MAQEVLPEKVQAEHVWGVLKRTVQVEENAACGDSEMTANLKNVLEEL